MQYIKECLFKKQFSYSSEVNIMGDSKFLDLVSGLKGIQNTLIAHNILTIFWVISLLCIIPILLRIARNRGLNQQIFIASLTLALSILIGGTGSDPSNRNIIDLKGELLIVRGTAFSLLGRPNLVKNKQIFHQTYNLTKVLDLFDRISYLGKLVSTQCTDYVEKVGNLTYSDRFKPGRSERSNLLPRKYEVLDRVFTSAYEAQMHCEKAGMKLPEPMSDQDVIEIASTLREHNLPRVAAGVIFDDNTYTWRYKHSGKIPETSWFSYDILHYAVNLDPPLGKASLHYRIDDRNSNLFIELPARLIFRTIGSEKYSNSYLELSGNAKNYFDFKKTPVLCERLAETKDIPTQESIERDDRTNQEWGRTIDLCKITAAHINQSAEMLTDRFARIVNQAGLYFEKPSRVSTQLERKVMWGSPIKSKDKRFLMAALGKMLTFIPGLALDIYKEFILDRRINNLESTLEDTLKQVKTHSTRLTTIELQLKDITILTHSLTLMVQRLYHIVSSIRDMHAVTQTLAAINLHHQEILMHAHDSLIQLDDVLTSLMNHKIPISMTGNIRKFVTIKNEEDSAFMLSPDRPIGLDPVIKDDLIHVFTTFLEGGPKFDLYQITPLPYFENSISVTRKLNYEFVLIDGRRRFFAPLTREDLPFCLSGVCPVRHVLQEIQDDKCGVIALLDTPFHPDCPATFGTTDPVFIQSSQGLIYSVPNKITARLSCQGKADKAGIEGEPILEGVGVVTIPNGCDLLVDKPDIIMQGPVHEILRSIASLDIIQSDFDGIQWSARAIDLSTNLTQITQTWIAATVKEKAWYFYLLIIIISLITLVIIGIVAFKLLFVAKSYRKWKYIFKEFKETALGEARRAQHMAETVWKLLNPLGRREATQRYLTTAQEDTPPLEPEPEEGDN